MSAVDQMLYRPADEPVYNGGTFPVVTIKPQSEPETNEKKKTNLLPIVVVLAIMYFIIKK